MFVGIHQLSAWNHKNMRVLVLKTKTTGCRFQEGGWRRCTEQRRCLDTGLLWSRWNFKRIYSLQKSQYAGDRHSWSSGSPGCLHKLLLHICHPCCPGCVFPNQFEQRINFHFFQLILYLGSVWGSHISIPQPSYIKMGSESRKKQVKMFNDCQTKQAHIYNKIFLRTIGRTQIPVCLLLQVYIFCFPWRDSWDRSDVAFVWNSP